MQSALGQFYQNTFDLKTAVAMGAIILAVTIVILWYSFPTSGNNSRRGLRRMATSIGLKKKEIRMLESFVGNLRKPKSLMANTEELNKALAKALENCSKAKDPMAQNRQLEIYRIKQVIDRSLMHRGSMISSRQLKINQKITFQQKNGERLASWINANLKEFYCAGVPGEFEGGRWNKGSRIKLLILGINGEEIVFESKILGYTNIMAVPSVILKHAVRKNQSPIREHRRRTIDGPIVLYPVRIVEKKQKNKLARQMLVDKRPILTGNLIDLSPGGCSISLRSSPDAGELFRLIYEIGGDVAAFGKIVNTRVINRARSIVHVKFIEASVESMNLINSYVYKLS